MTASPCALACMEQEISRVGEEVRQHIIFLCDLRAKRNSLLPVFRLPLETIAIIFVHGARDYYENGPAGRTSCIPSWVNVSYVCCHWRNIALNCSTLWSYHFSVSPRWTEELLSRSKQALLKISCIYPDLSSDHQSSEEHSWWLRHVDGLLKHPERVQELRLHLPLDSIPHDHPLCTSRLESLEIQLDHQPEWALMITDEGAPVLRKLKLVCCPVPLSSLNLSRLNTLSLHYVARLRLNMGEFLALLGSMQDLSILRLEHSLPSARGFLSGGGLGTSPRINLPHLTLLAVVAPLTTVIALLSCIDSPPKSQLNLTPLPEGGPSARDFAPVSTFLAQRFSTTQQQSLSLPIIRSLAIVVCWTPQLTFSSLVTSVHDCFVLPTEELSHDVPLRITLGGYDEEIEELWEMDPGDKYRIISDVCSTPSLRNIQSFHVVEPSWLGTADLWKEILKHLERVQYMKLSYGPIPDLSFLSLAVHEPMESPGGQPACGQDPTSRHIFVPALEELELCHINFVDDTTCFTSHASMSRKSLFDVLSTRRGLRDRLRMIGCSVKVTGRLLPISCETLCTT